MRVNYNNIYAWQTGHEISIEIDEEMAVEILNICKLAAKDAVNAEDVDDAIDCLRAVREINQALKEYDEKVAQPRRAEKEAELKELQEEQGCEMDTSE